MSIKSILILLLTPLYCFGTYHSQIGQDEFVNSCYFKNKQFGIFVDIGAHDGVSLSNTCFFEKELGWQGLCVEPIPEVFCKLLTNRSCNCVRGCVTDFTGPSEFFRVNGHFEMLSGLVNKYSPIHIENVKKWNEEKKGSYDIIEVECFLLNDLLDRYGYSHIDFLSIDTEGGEYDIISSIDYSKYIIDVITLEDNFRDPRFVPFLESKGFQFVCRNQFDLLFVRKDFLLEQSEESQSN